MTVEGPRRLSKLIKEFKLVEGLSEREMERPEGAGFDLCMGKVSEIFGEGFLGIGVTGRKTADSRVIMEYDPDKSQILTFNPGDLYLVTTVEKINTPINLTADLSLRSTLYRSGLRLSGGNIAPDYHGDLSFTIKNDGPAVMKVELGARIVFIQFKTVRGATPYKGQWGNGRITTNKLEKQI